jgi:hypothetical protein
VLQFLKIIFVFSDTEGHRDGEGGREMERAGEPEKGEEMEIERQRNAKRLKGRFSCANIQY